MSNIMPQNTLSQTNTKKFDAIEIFMHLFLLTIGLIVSAPIWIAVFASFKIPEAMITYPPTLLPNRLVKVEVEGYEDLLTMFTVTYEDGTTASLARVGQEGNQLQLIDPKNPEEIIAVNVSQAIPQRELYMTFENYITAWNAQPLWRYFVNSVIQTGIIVLFQVIFSILAAYAFAILEFPGRNFLFFLILGSLMVPFQLTFIPNFVFVSRMGWANTYIGLTVPFLASAFGVFMLRQFFLSLPSDLYDAAKVDGATSWRYLWQIVVPLSRGSISAFTTFAFLSAWSQYLWPLIITDDAEMRTMQIAVRFFLFDQERGADWGAIMAVAIIALIPTLVLFLVAQQQLVRSIATTGLKG